MALSLCVTMLRDAWTESSAESSSCSADTSRLVLPTMSCCVRKQRPCKAQLLSATNVSAVDDPAGCWCRGDAAEPAQPADRRPGVLPRADGEPRPGADAVLRRRQRQGDASESTPVTTAAHQSSCCGKFHPHHSAHQVVGRRAAGSAAGSCELVARVACRLTKLNR